MVNKDNDGNVKKNDFVNKTFRLKTANLKRLELDANRLNISVNSLIQNMIQKFIEWDRYAESVEFVSITPNMLDAILEFVPNDTIERIAKHVGERSCFKDVSLLIFQRYTIEDFYKMVSLLDRYGNNYRMQVRGDGSDQVSVSLYHNYGKRWSLFIGGVLHYELNRLKVDHAHEFSDNAIVFDFKGLEGAPALVDSDKFG